MRICSQHLPMDDGSRASNFYTNLMPFPPHQTCRWTSMQQLKVNCASWERQLLSDKLSLISWKRQVLIIFCVNWHLGICRWMRRYTPHRPFDPKSWLELAHREIRCVIGGGAAALLLIPKRLRGINVYALAYEQTAPAPSQSNLNPHDHWPMRNSLSCPRFASSPR